MIAKARACGADAVILDLEDGVSPEEKQRAREVVARALDEGFPTSLVVLLRVNGLETGLLDADLGGACRPRLDGICLPKCETAAAVLALDARLRLLEERWGQPAGRIGLLPMIESAQGVLRAAEIARGSPRVCGLGLGAEDLTADLAVARTREGTEVAWARSAVGMAAHAAGVPAIDGIFADFHDEPGLRADTSEARRRGFGGKMLIHPAQIRPVHEALAPTADEVERARKVVSAFEAALAAGSGIAVVDGAMVDRPVFVRAQRVLAIADRAGPSAPPRG
jgi:citrate lyase subunit beta/citryl-CoA lyase